MLIVAPQEPLLVPLRTRRQDHRMKLSLTLDRRVAGLAIISGFVAVMLAAQSAAVSRPGTARLSDAPAGSAEIPTEQILAPAPPATAATTDSCETQHWPYYSNACLRGDGGVSAPRHIHLQQTSAPVIKPTPVAVAAVETVGRKPKVARQVSETPRPRQLRRIARNASRPTMPVRQMQPESAGPEQALAFSW